MQCERCDDVWLKEVQHELRIGSLSKDNHRFLRGEATSVPGSWVNDDVACKNGACRKLRTAYLDEPPVNLTKKRKLKTDEKIILEHECEICKQERASKCRVAKTGEEFHSERFADVPAIFANNDVKYDANKSRAQLYANRHKLAATFACA